MDSNTNDPLSSVKQRLRAFEEDPDKQFVFDGMRFSILPGVFPPSHFQSTRIFTEELEYPAEGAFWEVGCGAGVTAIVAAKKGCTRVLASDISDEAVSNTRENVLHHNVEDIVSVRSGDLFDVLNPDEQFNLIYWNSNFVLVPDSYSFDKSIYHAFADAGYRTHDRFLKKAPDFLSPGGRIVLGFSGQGDGAALRKMFNSYNYNSEVISSRVGRYPSNYRYDLVELFPRAPYNDPSN